MQDFIFVRKNGRYEKVRFDELIFVKAMRGYMQVVTERQVYFVLNTIEEVEKYLPKELFCRTHRSYIVAINRIETFSLKVLTLSSPPDGKEYAAGLSSLRELPVGKAFRKNLRNSVTVIPNRMGNDINKVVSKAAFLLECQIEEE